MLYDITLRIIYRYATPAASARTILRMQPRQAPDQRMIQGLIDCNPVPFARRDRLDFYGNPLVEMAHQDALSEVEFKFKGRVERLIADRGLDLSGPWQGIGQEVAAVASLSPDAPHHFLGPSPRIPYEPAIAGFAQEVVQPDMSALDAARAVSNAIHDAFAFDAEATDVSTSPAEAFEARRGVCQDFTHVAIAALRSLGIPAGYVSGFLRTEPPEGQPRLEGADAMHAWVRAWCGKDAGWHEFDPTNAIDVAGDHVVVAYGRDYSDVAPVKGAMRSAGSHSTLQQVDMIPVEPVSAASDAAT
ncbi:transglutaminase family protein [Pseudoprimorskyibacter insulae]|uniref:Transglutaminase-like domain-containing protein n=1 Tax=Pseudoprimorskyibacter insulae TaxID=1695997 RepID=A0A2R8AQT6_9RHOB|nr:transglutaminase family protein [Pseudoprimorskyibacter insulae]SPF78194.1 hypothetical protein PRI8871_00787 [Pseudoprimorskyibacter insulae]